MKRKFWPGNRLILRLALCLAAALLTACAQTSFEEVQPTRLTPFATQVAAVEPAATARLTAVVRPTALAGYVPNPNMGWQEGEGSVPRFAQTVGYDRIDWNLLNPAEGSYNWLPVETLRQKAQSTGDAFSFRVRPSRPPPWGEGHTIPDWVIQQGAIIVRGTRSTEPLYASCLYLETHGRFVEAMRQKYDGDPDLAFLDVGSYGYFGDWYSDQYDARPETLDWHARRWIADMYLGGEATRPCMDAYGRVVEITYQYAGFQQTQLVMPYTPGYEDSLDYVLSRRQDVGIRHDALGSEAHHQLFRDRGREYIEQTWPREPVVFEFASDAFTADALERARAFAQEMHASYVHETLGGRGNQALLEAVLEVVGYRLALQEIRYTTPVRPGETLFFEMNWVNSGSAPPYQTYPLVLWLTDAAGQPLYESEYQVDIQTWLPGAPIHLNGDMPLPAELPAGPVYLRLAFVDPATRQPVLNLAMDGRDEQGRYLIGAVEVVP